MLRLQFPVFWLAALFACRLCAQSDTRSDIEKLGVPYEEKLGDTTATLTYLPTETATNIFFKINGPGNKLPPLETQCQLLDRLLGRILKDHSTESEYVVLLAPMQESLMEPLQRFLLGSSGWDSLRGRPRNGRQLGEFLTEALNKSGVLDPIAKVFDHHGLSISAVGMNRIDIQKIPQMHDARLPLYIWEIDFVTHKK